MNISISKNRKKSTIKILAVLTIIVASILANPNFFLLSSLSQPDSGSEKDLKYPIKASNGDLRLLVDSEPIYIEGKQGWIDLKNAGKCTGSGTNSDPYIIQNLRINGSGYEVGIQIKNSNEYFIIEHIESFDSRIGIYLENVQYGTITNNVFYNFDNAIFSGPNCRHNIISLNYLYNNHIGVQLCESCDFNIIKLNVIEDTGDGIYLRYFCHNNTISKNSLSNILWRGIFLEWGCNCNIIKDNNINEAGYAAIQLRRGPGRNIISGNVFPQEDAIILVEDPVSNIIAVNSFNNFYTPIQINDNGESGFTWQEASSFSWCSGYGTKYTPYIITNLRIHGREIDSCILITNSDAHFVIENCEVVNSGNSINAGIKLINTTNGKIINNTIINNFGSGIYLNDYSINNEISGNEILYNKRDGIFIASSTDPPEPDKHIIVHPPDLDEIFGNIIINNVIKDNQMNGISIEFGIHKIKFNVISDNKENGILINYIYDTDQRFGNLIEKNLIKENGNNGIQVKGNFFVFCIDNQIELNYGNGIHLWGSSIGSFFTRNIFLYNGVHNAHYQNYMGLSDMWFNNLWSDYDGVDINDDGVGDTAYWIYPHKPDPDIRAIIDYEPIWNDGIENEDLFIHINDKSLFTFNWIFARIHGICTGDGTVNDPYKISSLNLNGNSVKNGMLIENSSLYFKLENNVIQNTKDYGIKLLNVKNGLITDCQIFSNSHSIYLKNSQSNNITYNAISGSLNGILLRESNNNIIAKTIFQENHYYGIYLIESNNNSIDNCRFENHFGCGIELFRSHHNQIIKCLVSNSRICGVYLNQECCDNRILKNSFMVNTRAIMLSSHCCNINISENAIAWVVAYGIFVDNCEKIFISKNKIIESNNFGLYLDKVSDLKILENHIINNGITVNRPGISVLRINGLKVIGNTIANNTGGGLVVKDCQNVNISQNNIYNNLRDGIKITNSITTPCVISQNKIWNNGGNGILLQTVEDCIILGNSIQFNGVNGILISGEFNNIFNNYISENTANGIRVLRDSNSITKNKIFQNNGNGIEISSNNNIIRKNHIQDNIDLGIHATYETTNNLIFENILYHNYGISIDPHISDYYDALDNGSSNAWDNGVIGNYWSLGYFYDGNNDGINDFPIFFPGNVDNYPIYNASHYEFKKVEVNSISLYPGEPILFTCHFSEDWGIKNISIKIKKSGEIIAKINLFDDGSHSDKIIGDMIYTNTLYTNDMEATTYDIDVYYEDFLSVMNSELDAASFVIKVPRTLILVHGYDGNSAQFSSIYNNPDVIETYGERIIRIDYYGEFMGVKTSIWFPSIEGISLLLAFYIMTNHDIIRGNIDFVCHSMGGLVVRYMIKHFYDAIRDFFEEKKKNFNITHVCHLATPNHGTLTGLLAILIGSIQGIQMIPGSPFLKLLNFPDETPYSDTIEWYTYRGSLDPVATPYWLIPLIGARENRFYDGLNHDTIRTDPDVLNDLFTDLDIPGYEQLTLTETGVPLQEDTSIEVSSLQLDSPPVEPSLNLMNLQTHLILENNAPIDPSSVKIKINPEYDMLLKSGTTSIFELNFTLPDGIYTYTITALDLDGNQYSIQGELSIIDDDITPPFINYTYYGDYTDGNSGFIRVIASDFSGLSIDPSGDYPVPNRLGTHFFSFLAKDHDNDRSEDSLSTTLEVSITIEDDDTAEPEIVIDYFGGGTDGDPGYFSWYITDTDNGIGGDGDIGFSMIDIKINYTSEDGLSTEEFILSPTEAGTWNLPLVLGTYEIIIEAIDNDDDRTIVIDSLLTTLAEIQTIIDDDITPPEITIEYIGEGNDFNPGYFSWDVFDADSGLSEINITIIYESTEGLDDYIISFEGTETGSWNLPPNLGTYTIIITARDNDDDRTLIIDSLSTEAEGIQEIIDDDVNPPELSDLEITAGIFEINISLVARDESGIKSITLLINGEVNEPISQIQDGDNYFFVISNHWLFEKGLSEVEVLVEDGDNDRLNDSLISSISGSFKNVLYQMYEYVDWQLEELKDFIEENLWSKISHSIIKKISQAQNKLIEAFGLIENGNITCGIMHICLAKIYINIAEHKTYIYHKLKWINDNNASYIFQLLRDIRNNIVYIKGASTGVKPAVDISYIEVELLNLVDFIEQNVKSKSLINTIRVSAEILDIAIILISLNENPKELLCFVQGKLERAICKIDRLLGKEKISQELADYLINKISQQIEAIEMVKDDLVTNESFL